MFRPLQGHHQPNVLVFKYKQDAQSLFRKTEISVLQILFTCCSTVWLKIKMVLEG